ncbi:MAG: tRNA lysidine(34) synthetase TilS [Bacilli bacterium]|nr:tRNA lysidine(34) synthetase TilS [Bacilli bacterium]
MLEHFNMNLIQKKDSLLLAISGGIDSMVLLDFLAKQQKEMGLTLTVAHLDHQKRTESFLDCQLILDTCKKLSIKTYIEQLQPNENENFHDYAHKQRFDFFARVASEINADKIVLAHNANDNAETILMRMVRGSSFEGYRGILPISSYKGISVIRPMIEVTRDEIITYQKHHLISYNEDQSNSSDEYTRNRFRHHVFPFLQQENPKYLEKFTQFTTYQSMAYSLIEKLSSMYLEVFTKETKNGIQIDIDAFKELEPIIQIETIKRIINDISDNSIELNQTNLDDIRAIIHNKKPHVEMSLHEKLHIQKSYNMIDFTTFKLEFPDFEYEINTEQKLNLPDGSLVIITKNTNKLYGVIYKLCYNNGDFTFPLSLRNRKDGDRIKTEAGTKKLKNMFINRKVPILKRDTLPLLLNKKGEILWIPGIHQTKTEGNNCLYIIYQEGK